MTIERSTRPTLRVHMCDVFARRNTNRTQMQEIAVWPKVIARAQEQGLPSFEVDGAWPWNEAFFPKPSAITNQDGQ